MGGHFSHTMLRFEGEIGEVSIKDKIYLEGPPYIVDIRLEGGSSEIYRVHKIDDPNDRALLKIVAPLNGQNGQEYYKKVAQRRMAIMGAVSRNDMMAILGISYESYETEKFGVLYTYTDGRTLEKAAREENLGASFTAARIINTQQTIRALLETIYRLIDANVVHRDIKPTNIVLRSDPDELSVNTPITPTIIDPDFLCHRSEFQDVNSFAGTPLYTSPEQARGGVTLRADLYGLGCSMISTLEEEIRKAVRLPISNCPEEVKYAHANNRFFHPEMLEKLLPLCKKYPSMLKEKVEGIFRLLTALVAHEPENRPGTLKEANTLGNL